MFVLQELFKSFRVVILRFAHAWARRCGRSIYRATILEEVALRLQLLVLQRLIFKFEILQLSLELLSFIELGKRRIAAGFHEGKLGNRFGLFLFLWFRHR